LEAQCSLVGSLAQW